MKLHLSNLSPRAKPNPSASASSPLPPPVSSTDDDTTTTLSFVMAAKASKARAVGRMSQALASLKTKTLYLITTDERYHSLDVPGQYTSLSLALGMSFREYADLTVEGGFLRPPSLLGKKMSGGYAPSSLLLEVGSDDQFCRPLPPSTAKKLGMSETWCVLGGVRYHFVHRSFSAWPYAVPHLSCAPHFLVNWTSRRGRASVEPGTWDGEGARGLHDENQVNDLERRVAGLAIQGEEGDARSGDGATSMLPAARRHLVPQSRSPNDEVAEAWVQHGLALDFGLDESGVRKCRDFPIPSRQLAGGAEPAPASRGTIKTTALKSPTPTMKLLAVHIAVTCCNYLHAGYTRQDVIAKAVVNIVCYDFGFVRPRGHTVFRKWVEGLGAALATNVGDALARLDGAVDAGPTRGSATDIAYEEEGEYFV
jgi:hypothetical protein